MLQDLRDIQKRLEPHLEPKHYTFIGPVNQDRLASFIKRVNDIAPARPFIGSLHDALSNSQAVQSALDELPSGEPLRLYVIQNSQEDMLIHDTVEGYCEKNNIDFVP